MKVGGQRGWHSGRQDSRNRNQALWTWVSDRVLTCRVPVGWVCGGGLPVRGLVGAVEPQLLQRHGLLANPYITRHAPGLGSSPELGTCRVAHGNTYIRSSTAMSISQGWEMGIVAHYGYVVLLAFRQAEASATGELVLIVLARDGKMARVLASSFPECRIFPGPSWHDWADHSEWRQISSAQWLKRWSNTIRGQLASCQADSPTLPRRGAIGSDESDGPRCVT